MSTPTKAQVCYLPERGMWRSGISKIDGEIPMLCAFAQLGNKADGELWADATNVYTETGLTPSQLAEQRAELLTALMDVIGWVPGREKWHTDAPILAVENARAAIEKATQTHQVIATAHHDSEINATIVTPE